MARTDNLTNFLTDVADAIRSKKGTTGVIQASSFDTEISSITTGTTEDLTTELTEQDDLLTSQEATIDEIFTSLQNKIAGGEISLQEKSATPTTNKQTITADSGYDGLAKVTINGVTSSIDSNIQANNIRSGISILGVGGTLEEGITPTGTLDITENGSYDVTNFANALVNVATSGGGETNVVSGSFIPTENYTSTNQYFEVDLGFTPSEVVVYRRAWVKGIQSINLTFRNSYMGVSITNTASSNKASEKIVGSSYITINENGFKVTGNGTYYLVGGVEYIYVAVKDV